MKRLVPLLLLCALSALLSNRQQAVAFPHQAGPAANSCVFSAPAHTHAEAETFVEYAAGSFFSAGVQKDSPVALLYAAAAFASVVMMIRHLFTLRKQAFLHYLSCIFPFHSFW